MSDSFVNENSIMIFIKKMQDDSLSHHQTLSLLCILKPMKNRFDIRGAMQLVCPNGPIFIN